MPSEQKRNEESMKFIRSCRNISKSINQYNLPNVRMWGVKKKLSDVKLNFSIINTDKMGKNRQQANDE